VASAKLNRFRGELTDGAIYARSDIKHKKTDGGHAG
jgi:hypothetical protein